MCFNLWGITFCADGITFCGSLLDDHIITFWVKWYYILSQQFITFCAGRYYILRQVLHFAPMVLHFAAGITFCAVITFCGSTPYHSVKYHTLSYTWYSEHTTLLFLGPIPRPSALGQAPRPSAKSTSALGLKNLGPRPKKPRPKNLKSPTCWYPRYLITQKKVYLLW